MPTKDLSLLLTVLAAEEASIKGTYQRRLKSISSRYDTDDLFGDIQLRAIRDWNRCTSTDLDGVRKWVRVMARNMSITALERHIGCKKRSVRLEAAGSGATEFNQINDCATCHDVDQVELEELLQKCRKAVDTLPSRQAKAIHRRILDDVEYGVIATEMAVSVGAVRSLVSKGISSCREQVAQYSGFSKERNENDQTNDQARVERR